MSCEKCSCEDCHMVYGDGDIGEGSDFECPECGEELNDDTECANEQCDYFESNPFLGGGHDDDAKWERQQMGICG